jgi:hypothetical protein
LQLALHDLAMLAKLLEDVAEVSRFGGAQGENPSLSRKRQFKQPMSRHFIGGSKQRQSKRPAFGCHSNP